MSTAWPRSDNIFLQEQKVQARISKKSIACAKKISAGHILNLGVSRASVSGYCVKSRFKQGHGNSLSQLSRRYLIRSGENHEAYIYNCSCFCGMLPLTSAVRLGRNRTNQKCRRPGFPLAQRRATTRQGRRPRRTSRRIDDRTQWQRWDYLYR